MNKRIAAFGLAVALLLGSSALADSRSSRPVHGRPYYAHGPVSRINRDRGGYRVWIGNVGDPFLVSPRYFARNRFRVGDTVTIGGVYDRRGYYVYAPRYDAFRYDDARGYDGANGDGLAYSAATLRGVIDSVDLDRGTFVLRNDLTGSLITVGFGEVRTELRAGDHVELDGNWRRTGLFDAHAVAFVEDER
ncbi:MAG: hypothetical protein JO197_20875 [Acidobacteria bacterium]|nr:hypothetical protein [Acidobacteriota bacterium]MBV9476955.1 hypothetical protein [Acidobacteriota bacterium]